MFTDSYIVRVYRRDTEDLNCLIGLVEIIETQEKKPFNTFDELRVILKTRGLNAKHKQRGARPGETAPYPKRPKEPA